jgi:hypothetical protein
LTLLIQSYFCIFEAKINDMRIRLNTALFLLFISSFQWLNAQVIVLEESPETPVKKEKYGPNRTHHFQTLFSFGLPASPSEGKGTPIDYGNSWYFDWGVKYKLRLNQTFALCSELSYYYESYALKHTPNKSLPDNTRHDYESVDFNGISLAVTPRLNLNKRRGNHLGSWLDAGFYGDWAFGRSHNTSNDLADGSSISVSHRKIPYANRLNYGISAGLGYNKIALIARYRLSDVFKKEYIYAEVPRLTLGFRFTT